MTYNFDAIVDRRNTESIKWRTYDPDVLPMWIADTDFLSPEPVIRALRERVEHGVFGYPMDDGKLRGTVTEWMAKRYGWSVPVSNIMPVIGVVVGFNLVALAASGGKGGGVLVQTPSYPPFLAVAKNTGMVQQENELLRSKDGDYSIDFDAFEKSFTPETKVFMLCNPQNPSGRVLRKDELEKIAEICLRKGVVVCADEIHCDLVYSGHKHIPFASLDPEIARNTITLIAPSKTFNIAGLCASFAVITNPELREKMEAARQGISSEVNLLGLTAAQAAYAEGAEWLDEQLVYLEGNRDFACDFIKREMPELVMGKPEGTYLAWIDARGLGLKTQTPAEFFVKHARVGLNDGKRFGKPGEGYVRLNFGCPRATLTEGLERMARAVRTAPRE